MIAPARLGTRPLVLAALRQEAAPIRRVLRPEQASCITSGVGPRRAAAAARQHAQSATLVVSAGCCGGLDPSLPMGQLIIPEQVLLLAADGSSNQRFTVAKHWREAACQAADQLGLRWSSQPLATSAKALFSAASKLACHEATGAVGVDMESAVVAAVAAELDLPFFALRVVLDTAEEALPERAHQADGRTRPRALAAAALKGPATALSMAALLWRLGRICQPLAEVLALTLRREG